MLPSADDVGARFIPWAAVYSVSALHAVSSLLNGINLTLPPAAGLSRGGSALGLHVWMFSLMHFSPVRGVSGAPITAPGLQAGPRTHKRLVRGYIREPRAW